MVADVKVVMLVLALCLLQLAVIECQRGYPFDLGIDFKTDGRNRDLSVDLNKKFGNVGVQAGYKTNFQQSRYSLGGSYGSGSGFNAKANVQTSDGSRYTGSLGAGYSGKGWNVGGTVDTSGNWGIGGSYRWGKRRRRSMGNSLCKSCISVDVVKSAEKLKQYGNAEDVDFAMTAKFYKMSYNSSLTELDFKVVEVLREVPSDFDFKQAKYLNIYANDGACVISCLKGILPGEYLITGKVFKGQLVIHGKFLLLRLPEDQNQKKEIV